MPFPRFPDCRSCCEPFTLCSLGSGRHRGTTAEKGHFVKYKKSAALVAGAVMALGMAAPAMADAGASGAAHDSPGILSGNVIQLPVNIPLNLCGNSVDVASLLNPAAGNRCVNN